MSPRWSRFQSARREFGKFEPEFFRKAKNSTAAQTAYSEWQLRQSNVIAFVHQDGSAINCFAIASLIAAPPVYEPGGLTALIDDFAVAGPELWGSVSEALFRSITDEARRRGAVQAVAICAHQDQARRESITRWFARGVGMASHPALGGVILAGGNDLAGLRARDDACEIVVAPGSGIGAFGSALDLALLFLGLLLPA